MLAQRLHLESRSNNSKVSNVPPADGTRVCLPETTATTTSAFLAVVGSRVRDVRAWLGAYLGLMASQQKSGTGALWSNGPAPSWKHASHILQCSMVLRVLRLAAPCRYHRPALIREVVPIVDCSTRNSCRSRSRRRRSAASSW